VFRFTWLSDAEEATLRAITSRDWTRDALRLGDTNDEALAADAVALGAVACHGFGNFYAISTHPDALVVRHVNEIKGRPLDQVGSVTTTREHIPSVFDWSKLPSQLGRSQIEGLFDALLECGPFGFRGPAAAHLPEHLTAQDSDVRTTQIVSGGYRCAAQSFLEQCLQRLDENYLYITSANRSRFQTGAADEPAHFALRGLQDEFGQTPGILMLAHQDERRARLAYPNYTPNSTTILAFHRVEARFDRPTLRIERHGSLHIDDVRPIAARFGLNVVLGPNAQQRLPVRSYNDLAAA
jgi:hypothetical protein